MKTESHDDLLYGGLIAAIGRLFINKPYKAETLENAGKEKLIVNVSAFDCTTFVETVLVLARCAASGKVSPRAFRENLKTIRYRHGKIDGYASRLHYFTDWLRDNETKSFLKDISKNLGGKIQCKKINFMTAHRELYPALENKKKLAGISAMEKNLSRKTFYVIDKDKINAAQDKIRNGDVIAFTTSQNGLDVAHVGFALREGKSVRLLHASQKEGKVVVSKKTLVDYLKSNKTFTGIIIARPLF